MADTKHAEMLQDVISRMGGNSFLAKGWSITIAAALFALAAKDGRPVFLLVGILPIAMFWLVDAYYLALERAFRGLYATAAARIVANEAPTYAMNARLTVGGVIVALIRPATAMVHAPVLAALVLGRCLIR